MVTISMSLFLKRNRMKRVKKRKVDNDVFSESFERDDETTPAVG